METLTGSLISWAVAERILPGQIESGDRHVVCSFPGGVLLGAVDGLGHGPEAAQAAAKAVEVLRSHSGETVLSLLNRCHEELRATRGVVMSLASLRYQDATLTWLGVGNVETILLRADSRASPARESLVLHGGIVGRQLPLPYVSILTLAPADTLIFVTDGVGIGSAEGLRPRVAVRQLADQILADHWNGRDDALVLVVRYEGPGP